MRFAKPTGPRTPLRVAVLTFGAVVLLGTILALVLYGKAGVLGEDPDSPGRLATQAAGVAGLLAAAIAFVVQRRRTP